MFVPAHKNCLAWLLRRNFGRTLFTTHIIYFYISDFGICMLFKYLSSCRCIKCHQSIAIKKIGPWPVINLSIWTLKYLDLKRTKSFKEDIKKHFHLKCYASYIYSQKKKLGKNDPHVEEKIDVGGILYVIINAYWRISKGKSL